MTRGRVLVVDDKDNLVKLLARVLAAEFDVVTARDGARALELLSHDLDVVLSDVRMPGADGMTVLREVRRRQPETEVVLMTAFATIHDAVDAMKQGAYDYLQKPFEPDEAVLVVRRATECKALRAEARRLQAALDAGHGFGQLVGDSPPIRTVIDLVGRAARSDATVLVTGESGTGKEVVARAIHAASARAAHRFVAINCGAVPEALFEGELFGYARGAFTGASADHAGLFEEAAGGTLMLDEIGELPLSLQVKLNRALQERRVRRVGESAERSVDVRVIAATNRDLSAAMAEGRFRDDLFYRLNVLPIHLPPLRDRRADIPLLAAAFVQRHRRGGQPDGLTADGLAALMARDWPGNVRELENAVQRALAIADGSMLTAAAFADPAVAPATPASEHLRLEAMSYRDVIDAARDRATHAYLVALMRELAGNVTQAAERAGIERESLHRLLRRHGVRSEDYKPRS